MKILGYLAVDQCTQQRALDLLHRGERLIAVIEYHVTAGKCLVLVLLCIFPQLRVVKEREGIHALALIVFSFEHLGRIDQVIQNNIAYLQLIVSLIKSDLIIDLIIACGESLYRESVKNTGDGFVELSRFPACHAGKGIVEPEHTATIIRQCIRNGKFLDHALLNLSVLCGECHQIVQHGRLITADEYEENYRISGDSHGHKHAGRQVDHINLDIDGDQNEKKQERIFQMAFHLSCQFYFVHISRSFSKRKNSQITAVL